MRPFALSLSMVSIHNHSGYKFDDDNEVDGSVAYQLAVQRCPATPLSM